MQRPLVIDTNVVLDLLVFNEPAHALRIAALHQLLEQAPGLWLRTDPMADELARVLAYPKLAIRLDHHGLSRHDVLASYHARTRRVEPAAGCVVRCRDRDDQMFIDLAVAHQADLLSKDALVLQLRKRLLPLGVRVQTAEDYASVLSKEPAEATGQ